ncbi:golgin subfamily A member 5-like [Gossypium australe]|uniref:Golgin subfamily A member 5-like n=1 Tax=Gossypium australe TaxID=47621 RepID=A0A5B6VI72_9ROSI|nr:golgin subfamily A member 5-like [Gossypium australe]
MKNGFLDKVEDNAAVRTWSEQTQLEKGNSLVDGYVSELWDFTRISITQNEFQELKEIWAQWDNEAKQLFYRNYGDLPYLLDIKVDRYLFWAMAQFWNSLIAVSLSGKDLILAHPDTKKKVDAFALCIYGLVVFPKALRHIDEAVIELFDQLDKWVTSIPAILAETFRSLNACRREVFSENYSPTREDVSEENWIELLQNLREEDVEWKAPWMILDEILYRCGSFDWVPLLGILGAVGYAPLLVLRQYGSRQFIPATYGLAQCELLYRGDNYKRRVKEISGAWNQTCRMKRLSTRPMTTPEYSRWRIGRVNDNILELNSEGAQSREECLQVVPSELGMVKQDFERMSSELVKRIEKLEEEKICLRLDVDVHKLEAEKIRKEKRKIEEDRDSLKAEYKKMSLSMKNAGLGKSSEKWQREVQEEKTKADYWKKKFQETQAQNEALEKSLSKNQSEKEELKARVTELGRSLHHHRSRNSAIELKSSLNKIEEMKGKIKELESTLHGCELRIELLETREGRWKEELHHSQNQVRNRDYLMGEAIVQIREVADHLQTLASQADTLSMKYELQFDRS